MPLNGFTQSIKGFVEVIAGLVMVLNCCVCATQVYLSVLEPYYKETLLHSLLIKALCVIKINKGIIKIKTSFTCLLTNMILFQAFVHHHMVKEKKITIKDIKNIKEECI